MWMRNTGVGVLLVLLLANGSGCKKSAPKEPPTPPPPPPKAETVARIHWLGKKALAAETNASFLMGLWNLPESVKLETQTLDKLAAGLGPLLQGNNSATNNATLWRPLVEDLLEQESYLEVRHASNQVGELAFAIRLEAQRAGLWQTNLASLLESLTHIAPAWGTNQGWSLKKHDPPNFAELTRAGDWTIIGLGQDHNALVGEFVARIASEQLHSPFPPPSTNYWLEAELDLPRAATALGRPRLVPLDWPKLSLTALGEGQDVRTRGQFNFTKPLAFQIEPWNIPTNLIHDPLNSFTAMQGTGPWLSSRKPWADALTGTSAPNQLFVWSQSGMPLLSFWAAPDSAASNSMVSLSEWLLREANPWLRTNGMGRLERSTNFNGIAWRDIPFASPFLLAATNVEQSFLFGSMLPSPPTNRPPPIELLQQVLSATNLVAYSWELTGPRVEDLLYVGQLLRLACRKAQLPAESASAAWLKVLILKLGNSSTAVTRTGPDQLSFARKSSTGLTALELHLLADWLESPAFPRGLHMMLAEPMPLTRRRTNAPPASITNRVPAIPPRTGPK